MKTNVYLRVTVQTEDPCDLNELIEHVQQACNYGMEVSEPEGGLVDAEIVGWCVSAAPEH